MPASKKWGKRVMVTGLLTFIVAMFSSMAWAVFVVDEEPRPKSAFEAFTMRVAGVRRPKTVPASEARIHRDAKVIGIVVGGRARAYLVKSFDPVPGLRHELHVVNDLIAGIPVSVTHCVRTGCTRVYSSTPSSEPLPIEFGGWSGTGLLLSVENTFYDQQTGVPMNDGSVFPYPEKEFVSTTWEEWLESHPDTDLYQGAR